MKYKLFFLMQKPFWSRFQGLLALIFARVTGTNQIRNNLSRMRIQEKVPDPISSTILIITNADPLYWPPLTMPGSSASLVREQLSHDIPHDRANTFSIDQLGTVGGLCSCIVSPGQEQGDHSRHSHHKSCPVNQPQLLGSI